MMKGNKGFSLIELMVMIVVLAMLAAVIAPRIPQYVKRAKIHKELSEKGYKGAQLESKIKEVTSTQNSSVSHLTLLWVQEISGGTVYKYHDASNNTYLYVMNGQWSSTSIAAK